MQPQMSQLQPVCDFFVHEPTEAHSTFLGTSLISNRQLRFRLLGGYESHLLSM